MVAEGVRFSTVHKALKTMELEDFPPFVKELGSVEYQAGITIFEKYKRKNSLGRRDMDRIINASFLISVMREKQGKMPNKDFLIQMVGQFLNGKHPQQAEIELAIEKKFV